MDEKNKEPRTLPQANEGQALPQDFRAVIMYGMSNQEALAVMKAIKAISSSMKDTAFVHDDQDQYHLASRPAHR